MWDGELCLQVLPLPDGESQAQSKSPSAEGASPAVEAAPVAVLCSTTFIIVIASAGVFSLIFQLRSWKRLVYISVSLCVQLPFLTSALPVTVS